MAAMTVRDCYLTKVAANSQKLLPLRCYNVSHAVRRRLTRKHRHPPKKNTLKLIASTSFKNSPTNTITSIREAHKKTIPACLIAQGHTGLQLQRYNLFLNLQKKKKSQSRSRPQPIIFLQHLHCGFKTRSRNTTKSDLEDLRIGLFAYVYDMLQTKGRVSGYPDTRSSLCHAAGPRLAPQVPHSSSVIFPR